MKSPLKGFIKNILWVVLIFIFLGVGFGFLSFNQEQKQVISITQLSQEINEGKVREVQVLGNDITIIYNDDSKAYSKKEPESSLIQSIESLGVEEDKIQSVNFVFDEQTESWFGSFFLLVILPFLLFGLFFWFFFGKAKAGAAQTFDFTKAKAKLFIGGKTKEKITFKDVAGLKEEKMELEEIVDFLKNPEKYFKLGARIPKGVLLVGPAGCGKTLLAQAVAGESNVPFFSVAGSSFIELFVGVGSSRVRNLFSVAKKQQPCLIFIDELDSIGKTRGPAITGGNEEREQTLNQLLAEMDGFEKNDKIIVLAATNRSDVLDPALLRPGRFDRKVVISLPDINGRDEILKIHTRGKPLQKDVKLREVAERTPGFSGADLANVVNEAAILTARKGEKEITQTSLLESIEKVLLGPERRSHILSEEEKEIAAYHETGHALVATLTKSEPVRKISIVSRGMAAGYTLQVPEKERHLKRKTEYLSEIAVLLGGYVSEYIMFNEITSGASDDLNKASELARKIVKEFGMSSLGPISYGEREKELFLGREFGEQINYSEETAKKIDKEVESIILEAQQKADKLLRDNKKLLDKIARELIKKETIEKEEYEKLLK